jgi:hypothetical protein
MDGVPNATFDEQDLNIGDDSAVMLRKLFWKGRAIVVYAPYHIHNDF